MDCFEPSHGAETEVNYVYKVVEMGIQTTWRASLRRRRVEDICLHWASREGFECFAMQLDKRGNILEAII